MIVIKHELNNKSGVYVIRNLVNNKAYIGSAINLYKRRCDHFSNDGVSKSHNQHLNRSFSKYGINNFVFEVLAFVKDKEQLTTIETYYIQLFETHKPSIGYNIASIGGSNLGFKHTDETKQKFRENNLGKKHTDETKQKMSKSHNGKIFTKIHRENISKSKENFVFTEEHKRKISESNKGKVPVNHQGVIQLTLNNEYVAEYKSVKEASDTTGASRTHISSVCKGNRNTCGGFKWIYSSDYKRV